MNTIWRIIPSHPDYEASNDSRIRRSTKGTNTWPGRIIGSQENRIGYLHVALSEKGKRVDTNVHSLVAEAFLGIKPPNKVINHKDCNKKNCEPSNLEYVTREENERHAMQNGRKANSWRPFLGMTSPTRKLEPIDIHYIRLMRKEGATCAELAKKYKVGRTQIGRICNGTRWGWL